MMHESQTALLKASLDERGWSIRQLHRAMVKSGADISLESVRKWVVTGGGITDEHKLRLCHILGLDPGRLLRASVAEKNGGTIPPFDAASARLSA